MLIDCKSCPKSADNTLERTRNHYRVNFERKAAISFVISVRQHACISLASTERIFVKFDTGTSMKT